MSHLRGWQSELGGRPQEGWVHRLPHVCSAGSPLPEDGSADEELNQDAISGDLITTTPSDCAGMWPVSAQLGSELVSFWDADGQVSTLGVYTAHSPPDPPCTLKTFNKASLNHVEGGKEEGIRCLGHWLRPRTWACPARGRLHAAPVCTALFYKFSL